MRSSSAGSGEDSLNPDVDYDIIAQICTKFTKTFSLAMACTGAIPVVFGLFALVIPYGMTTLKPMTVISNITMLDLTNPIIFGMMAVYHFINIASPLCVAVFLFLNRPPWICREQLPFRSDRPEHRPVLGPALVWSGGTVVLLLTVVVEFFLNATYVFQVQRVAFCFLIFIFNTVMILLVKAFSERVEKEPSTIVKEGLMFDVHIVLVVVNTLCAISMTPFQLLIGYLERGGLPYRDVLTAVAAEGFAFLWLSFLTSQGLKFISDFFEKISRAEGKWGEMLRKNVVLSVVLVKTNPKSLYGSRELHTLKLLVVSYLQTFGLLNPWVGLLGLTCILVGSWPLAVIRKKLFFPDYKGELSLVPWRMPLVFGWLPLTSLAWVWIFLSPLGNAWIMINCIATMAWVVGAVHFSFVWCSDSSAERGEESRIRQLVIGRSKRLSVSKSEQARAQAMSERGDGDGTGRANGNGNFYGPIKISVLRDPNSFRSKGGMGFSELGSVDVEKGRGSPSQKVSQLSACMGGGMGEMDGDRHERMESA
uniref:Uncharacterized protein n=1 Tax=Chromera velia CCMP2878 TaxID=1169474 RepID=A0A0G4HMH5_9ALVE|eukprot:Cvel_29095.t1-p1 / transcript=Cvel_29095.t1 / gene=Cvel_29095 / organism=Chromera_velia_CCMP2878 / gene_product=hypothetical protein / transcript_product=hypothetical protein / location=Cvel_scaffold3927:187-1788(-) / protein_length=534 / sequence_SO=supercontig / SO=protein_coding / is_pseudo=false